MEEGTRPRLLRWKRSRMNTGWTDRKTLSCFCACAHVCLGSLPGHMKDFLEENRTSTFQSTSAEPTGEGRSSGEAV